MKQKDIIWVKLMQLGYMSGCHQLPERSFNMGDYQFPICARCTGVLIGQLIMLLQILFIIPNLLYCIIGIFIMFIDWFLQYIKVIPSSNFRRLTTGIAAGYGIIGIYYYIIIFVL